MIKLEKGKKLWCLQPSSESAGYGDNGYRTPWLGIITNNQPLFKLCTVSEHFPDGYDDDSNASCLIDATTPTFETEPEAIKAYVSLKMQEIHDDMVSTRVKLRALTEFCKKRNTILPEGEKYEVESTV